MWYKNIALFVASSLIMCVVAEFTLRALGYYGERSDPLGKIIYVDDDILPYRGRPNSESVDGTYGIPVKRNSKGWRDYDYEYPKKKGVFRIVALGDSVLNARGIWMDDVYAKRVEVKLNAELTDEFEVVMLSLGALNSTQEAHLLEIEGMKYDPDLVLVGYVMNDPAPVLRIPGTKEPSDLERVKRFLRQSSLVLHTWRSLKRVAWLTMNWNLSGKDGLSEADYYSGLHNDEERWNSVVAAFKKIALICREKQIQAVVVIFPIIYEFQNYPWLEVHAKVARAAQEEGLLVLDLLSTFETVSERDLKLGPGDYIHPNAYGHELAGEAIYRYLLGRELVCTGGSCN